MSSLYLVELPLARAFIRVLTASAGTFVLRQSAYMIELVRWPLFPVLYFVTLYLTYQVSGREMVAGYPVAGYLVVGVIGMVLWTSNLWDSGYAIEYLRHEGTVNSLFLSPANRSAVVMGYGLGSFLVLVIPASLILGVIVVALGIQFQVASPLAVLLSALGLLLASTSLGYVLAGFFVLTRRANVLANFLQSPIYLLSGAVLPVSELPDALQLFARVFPLSYGMDAMREALLAGATVAELAPVLVGIAASSTVLLLVGNVLLRRVEQNARNGAELDFE